MNDSQLVTLSKFLSRHLRHHPERLGLTLETGGWVDVEALLAASAKHRMFISRAELEEVVASNSKQRFSFSSDGQKIRANQGHSVDVDLQLAPAVPPAILYHGTGRRTVATILEEGLKKMSRHHVHLSSSIETAVAVGKRHGKPVVFAVDAGAMHRDGYVFYCSDNGVWLTDTVSPKYLHEADNVSA